MSAIPPGIIPSFNVWMLVYAFIIGIPLGLMAFFVMRPLLASYRVHFASYKTGRNILGAPVQVSDRLGFLKKKNGLEMLKISGIKDRMPKPAPSLSVPCRNINPLRRQPVLYVFEDINGNLHYSNWTFSQVIDENGIEVESPLLIPELDNPKSWLVTQSEATNTVYTIKTVFDKIMQFIPLITVVFLLIGGALYFDYLGKSTKDIAAQAANSAKETSQYALQIAQLLAVSQGVTLPPGQQLLGQPVLNGVTS